MMNMELRNEIREEVEYQVANKINYYASDLEEIDTFWVTESIRDDIMEYFEEEELTDDDEEEIFNMAYDLFEKCKNEELREYKRAC